MYKRSRSFILSTVLQRYANKASIGNKKIDKSLESPREELYDNKSE